MYIIYVYARFIFTLLMFLAMKIMLSEFFYYLAKIILLVKILHVFDVNKEMYNFYVKIKVIGYVSRQ